MHRGDQHSGEWQPVEVFDEVEQQLRLDSRPAVGKNLSITNIGSYNDASREVGAYFQQPIGVFQCAGPDYNALSTIAEKPLD
jgi:hypothetical protein